MGKKAEIVSAFAGLLGLFGIAHIDNIMSDDSILVYAAIAGAAFCVWLIAVNLGEKNQFGVVYGLPAGLGGAAVAVIAVIEQNQDNPMWVFWAVMACLCMIVYAGHLIYRLGASGTARQLP